MAVTTADVNFDMYDREIYASPYATYRRLRDEAPLYYNEQYNFYAVSRFDDVSRVLSERDQFISGKGGVYNIMTAGIDMPDGLFIFEDPPRHTIHRALVSRLFTPRAVSRIEPQIRDLFGKATAALASETRFDFMRDYAHTLPIRVIGMLFGLPEKDHAALQQQFHRSMNENTADTDGGALDGIAEAAVWFTEYLDWRAENPTDDLMTSLLNLEFEDETGTTRVLRREEIVTYLTLITGAGSDTTATAIGWAASLLSDHPDQRRKLRDDPELLNSAVEEVLRFEPPAYHIGRTTARDVELQGETVPAGSIVLSLPGAANRDERHYPDGDTFDVTRVPGQVFTFSFGPHFCLGASLARLEARIALENMLEHFGDWTVDHDAAKLTAGIDTRGWDSLPVDIAR